MRSDKGSVRLSAEEFLDERELQECLAESPGLLIRDGEPPVALVQREVPLPGAGSLDLLLVDADGVPVAVEVKLARNVTRREVLAQAIDYASDLSRLTFDELDDRVRGRLSSALEELAGESRLAVLKKRCGAHLRAGRVRIIVAVDSADEDIERNVRHHNDHSDTESRLVAIAKFDGGKILMSRVLIGGDDRLIHAAQGERSDGIAPDFQIALDAWDRVAQDGMKVRGTGKVWRTIRPDAWPESVHYAFGNLKESVEIGLHVEANVPELADAVMKFSGRTLAGGLQLQWSPKKGSGGYLCCEVPRGNAEVAVATMRELASLTFELVSAGLGGQG
jgi:hypothetical protein